MHKLPPDLAAYKAAQKTDDDTIGFFSELSPWSNFHHSPFTLEDKLFPTTEHWIQYSNACYFHDDTKVNAILASETVLEAKRVGYQVTGFDRGYE